MKYLKKFNESILDETRKKSDIVSQDIKSKLGTVDKDHKFCHNCGVKIEQVDNFCDQCGEKQYDSQKANQQSNNHTISGTLSKDGYDLILRSPSKFLDGTEIILTIRDKSNDSTLPINKEVEITGTTKNGKNPGFNNPIIVKSPKDISRIK